LHGREYRAAASAETSPKHIKCINIITKMIQIMQIGVAAAPSPRVADDAYISKSVPNISVARERVLDDCGTWNIAEAHKR
jgi:hypothetical protein